MISIDELSLINVRRVKASYHETTAIIPNPTKKYENYFYEYLEN